MFHGPLLKDGNNHSSLVIWVIYQQPEFKKCTFDNAISFPSILDYILNHFLHSKKKKKNLRTLTLTLHHSWLSSSLLVIAILKCSIIFAHLGAWSDSDSLVGYTVAPPSCNTFLLKLFRVTYAWTLPIPSYAAVPSSSVTLHSGIPLTHFSM